MKELDDIKIQMRDFSRSHGPSVIMPATVVSVSEDDATAHIKFSDGSELEDARLKSVVSNNKGFYALPAVGSIVQVARIENSDEVIVVAVSDVSKIVIKNSTDSMGTLLSSLIDEIQKIYAPKNTAAIAAIKLKLSNLLQ